jgi:anti-sigma factor RsiW
MCEFSAKLIAFLDRELADDEMAALRRHLQDCFECRHQLDAYEQVSKTFDAYCDAMTTTREPRATWRWTALFSGAAAAFAIAAAILFFLRTPEKPRRAPQPALAAAPMTQTIVPQIASLEIRAVHKCHAVRKAQTQPAHWQPVEPPIQIAFPAESMFPPGAMPAGVNFTAELSIAADGSAQQISLQPRLTGFKRSATQP